MRDSCLGKGAISSRGSRSVFSEYGEFSFTNGKLGESAMKAHLQLGKSPHYRFIETIQPGKVNRQFTREAVNFFRLALFAGHLRTSTEMAESVVAFVASNAMHRGGEIEATCSNVADRNGYEVTPLRKVLVYVSAASFTRSRNCYRRFRAKRNLNLLPSPP